MTRKILRRNSFHKLLTVVSLFVLLFLHTASTFAQSANPALSLADLLIALRSKKATLPERNAILADAVKERGITFALTPEIEKELRTTGADNALVEAVKGKSVVVKSVAVPAVVPAATPKPTPPPPDASFYRNRANAHFVSGDFELAAEDYTKAIELEPKDASLLMSRATANYVRKSFENAVSDYEKAAESGLNDVRLFHNLGDSYEKLGDSEKAMKAFEKALTVDASHVGSKSAHERLKNEFAAREVEKKRLEDAQAAENARRAVAASAPPKPVDLGQINSIATDLVRPVYPPLARQMSVQGKVVVQVVIDEEGRVISAKATEGASSLRLVSETAAKQSRFAPAVVGNKPVKATGFITYNFRSN